MSVFRRREVNMRPMRAWVESALQNCGRFESSVSIESGFKRWGWGLTYASYCFFVNGSPIDDSLRDRPLLFRCLDRESATDRLHRRIDKLRREIATLLALQACEIPFSTPSFICSVHDDQGQLWGMVETFLPGVPLKHKPGLQSVKTIARAAAEIHRLPVGRFPHLNLDRDRANHAIGALRRVPERIYDRFSAAARAREWIPRNLPDPLVQDCVLHGDLLPQNLISDIDDRGRDRRILSIVDWESARIGDPAYDLAIVSRGNRRILGVKHGLRELLKAYRAAGGAAIRIQDVRVHEMLLLLGWLAETARRTKRRRRRGYNVEFYQQKLQSVLQRATADSD